ncbi:DciA family protein [Neisseria musculi]|uniref:DUF721 domain-containing protein n=1 Tax=Neisseria musculi TaxID=1815583 RepID=A0A7H1MC71_9NEIS|nr:DciA family protein [Neisseria musculi]QNT59236.1 hypothetical protein H7A79_2520 [Neisseria musculi]
MDLNRLCGRDVHLLALLERSRQWRRLDAQVRQMMPANLRAHFQTACVENGVLVLLADNNMVSSRLRMIAPSLLPRLQTLHSDIGSVRVKVLPKTPPTPRTNGLKLSAAALESFRHCAGRLQHHPDLAQALQRLAEKHGKD